MQFGSCPSGAIWNTFPGTRWYKSCCEHVLTLISFRGTPAESWWKCTLDSRRKCQNSSRGALADLVSTTWPTPEVIESLSWALVVLIRIFPMLPFVPVLHEVSFKDLTIFEIGSLVFLLLNLRTRNSLSGRCIVGLISLSALCLTVLNSVFSRVKYLI
jgi:hypothetical protein